MSKRIIRLCYRKIIDASCSAAWDRLVWESSYAEFRMQFQLYNQEKRFTSFAGLLQEVPAAERLHFLVSAAVTGYVQQLNGKIPDIKDNLGRQCLAFRQFRFEIINSDTRDIKWHQIAVNFFSEPLIWHDIAGNLLLLSAADATNEGDEVLVNMVPLQPFLGIYSIKE